MNRKRVCFIVATEMTVKAFLLKQIAALSAIYDVSVIVDTRDRRCLEQYDLKVDVIPVSIARKIRLVHDLKTLWRLFVVFRRMRFDIVHSVTPKAGLLSMIAGKAAGVPVRVHTFTGQVWVTRKGMTRALLKLMDRILARFATHLLTDSNSQRQFLVDQSIVAPHNVCVVGRGSISGVDTQRFRPDPEARHEVRRELDVPESAFVFLYLGRLNRDKGVPDLASAFSAACCKNKNIYLIIAGPDEEGIAGTLSELASRCADRLRRVEYTERPERYMAASDVFVLPSYREGFGTVIIEAAACGIPAIGTRIYGVVDAIEEGAGGVLVDPADVAELANCMLGMAGSVAECRSMGERARARALRDFSHESVVEGWLKYYAMLC